MLGAKQSYFRAAEEDLLETGFGRSARVPLLRNVLHAAVDLRLRANVSIAGGVTSGTLRNRGRLAALLRRIEIQERGDASTEVDGLVATVFQAAFSPKEQTLFTALLNGGIQANTILEELVTVHFMLPTIGRPFETAFLERNPQLLLDLVLELVPDPYVTWIEGGDRVLTVNSFTAEVVQTKDARTGQLPLFIPAYRQIATETVNGVINDKRVELSPEGHIAMLIIKEVAGGGLYEASDILERFDLRSSTLRHFEGRITKELWRRKQETLFGGVIPAGYTVLPFLQGGRLGGIVNVFEDSDLQLRVTASPSAIAGQSSIEVWALELNKDQRVTAPLPASLAR